MGSDPGVATQQFLHVGIVFIVVAVLTTASFRATQRLLLVSHVLVELGPLKSGYRITPCNSSRASGSSPNSGAACEVGFAVACDCCILSIISMKDPSFANAILRIHARKICDI